jgi:hypothetical protein
MRRNENHLTDEQLLLTADGELAPRHAGEAQAHLAACPTCRARMIEIERAAIDFDRAYRGAVDRSLPSASDADARFRSKLATISGSQRPAFLWDFVAAFRRPGWAYVFAALLLVLGVVGLELLYQPIRPHDSHKVVAEYGAGPLMPNVNLTPGAVRAVTANQVCTADQLEEMRPPLPVQQAVFHEYGMDGAPAQEYEVDHLITPALGGTDDIRNLWPEPYSSTAWNAHVKDQLEDRLHELVCGGQLDLTTAQHDMATDWIAAYKKYFHTDKPLSRESDLDADSSRAPKS